MSEVLDTVMQQVKAIAKERAKTVTPQTNVVQLGLDSLERMDIIAHLEQTYDVRIPESELLDIETCREIADAIQRHKQDHSSSDVPPEYYQLDQLPQWLQLKQMLHAAQDAGESNPF